MDSISRSFLTGVPEMRISNEAGGVEAADGVICMREGLVGDEVTERVKLGHLLGSGCGSAIWAGWTSCFMVLLLFIYKKAEK
jgi:hypothetical protein